MDKVRKQEYGRLVGVALRYIKGQKYVLLSRWDNLTAEKQTALRELFRVNARLNKAYLLKESFGQLWSYHRPGWARRFFDRWKASLRWQRLPSFEKFAAMVESYWDGIEPYCRDENKVSGRAVYLAFPVGTGDIKDIPSIAVLSNIAILSREKFSHRTPYVASPTRSLVRR